MYSIDQCVAPRSLHNDTGGALGPSLLPWPAAMLRCSYAHALHAFGAVTNDAATATQNFSTVVRRATLLDSDNLQP